METIADLGSYTFPALLENSVRKFGDNGALSFISGTPVTYRDLGDRVISVRKMIIGLGLPVGSKIALYSGSMPNWGIAYLAVVNSGCIAVPLLPDFSAVEVEAIMAHCGVDALIVSASLFTRIRSLGSVLPTVIVRMDDFCIMQGGGEVVEKISAAKQVLARSISDVFAARSLCSDSSVPGIDAAGVFAGDFASVTLAPVSIGEDDTASIIYTSGTTGRSKGVELSHRNLVWNAVQGQTMHRINQLDRCLSFLPISHVYEFTIGFTMQIMNGACVYYLGKPPTVTALLPAFQKVRPTIVCAVPMIMEKIWKHNVLPEIEKNGLVKRLYHLRLFRLMVNRKAGRKLRDLFGGRLQFFGIGGSKIDPKVERFLKDARFPYAIGYGLTETAPLLAGSGPSITRPGTVGPVMEGVELQIMDPDPATGAGEVIARGPNVMKGYYHDPVQTAAAFTTDQDSCGAGWFRTGDLGSFSKNHGVMRLTLKGRSKNMILGASGENIYPEDIEFVLNQHPLVAESLVVEGDSGLVALVQIDEEKLRAEAERRASVKSRIAAVRRGEETVAKAVGDTVGDAVRSAKSAAMSAAGELQESIAYQREVLLGEIQFFVNSRVNRASRVSKIEEIDGFEKTASQKIKRYLYGRKKDTKKKK
jgi:long-chain acyl-CoA synthetase